MRQGACLKFSSKKKHCLIAFCVGSPQNMGFVYQQRRVELVARVLSYAARLGLADDYVHDAVLLMDRTMSTSLQACSAPFYSVILLVIKRE